MRTKHIIRLAALPLCCLLLGAASCTKEAAEALPTQQEPPVTETVAQELLVKFSPEVGALLEQAGRTRATVSRSGNLSVDAVLDLVEGYELERLYPVDAANEARTREAGMHLWYVVRFSGDCSVEEAAARLLQLGEVQQATPNRKIFRAYNTNKKAIPLSEQRLRRMQTRAATEAPFNDALLPLQWDLINDGSLLNKSIVGADVACQGAWKLSTGDPSIIVAVLDEGICFEHPDLAANMWHNEDEIYRSRQDNDGNGYAGDYYGYNFVNNTGIISWDALDDSGHATHVAGVIAAQNNNGIGISSIAGGTAAHPGVRVMSCQIFSGGYAAGTTVMMARAIKYAADNGAVVLQCSFGYVSGSANIYDWGEQGFIDEEEWALYGPVEKEAFEYFVHNAGSPNGPIDGGIAVFAAGNESAPSAGFPGAAANYISVTGTAADYTPAVYTNYGEGTNIAAPGGDQNYYYEYGGPDDPDNGAYGELGCILSTMPPTICPSGYGYMEGTSMACPHVSGVVALGLSYAMQLRKHFTADEFKALLYETATPIDEYLTGTKIYYRYVADVGLNQKMQMALGTYRYKMGAGQVNAERLLKAIEGSGRPIEFPNLYVALDAEVTVIPANYFKNGEALTYTVQPADAAIASCTIEGSKLKVRGLQVGATKATISASDGTTQSFVITVRQGASDKGWL